MPAIVLVDYDPAWPRLFEALRAPVAAVLGDLAVAIEHVGSTAVPGLPAKPIIDIDVIVPPERVATAIARLTDLGYVHKGDLGVPGREAMGHPPGARRHHLYVCPVGSVALANHLAVRDHLRANPEAARGYGDLKRRLAAQFADDVAGYVEAKSAFVLDVLRQAGFSERELADIATVNRRHGSGSVRRPGVNP